MFESLWVIYVGILGACLGSFANVIIYRLPTGKSPVTPRSHCQNCKTKIAWYDNIPIFSYFILRGRCRHCHARFSIRYVVVEFLMAAFFMAAFQVIGPTYFLIEALILIFGLVTVSFIDIDHLILPDVFTLPGIAIGLIGAAINPERDFLSAVLGVLLGGGVLWLIAYLYLVYRKEEGMGGGDIKLLAWVGAVLGWKAIPFVVLSSSVIGSLIGFALILLSKNHKGLKTVIPFGPYLALGTVIFLLGGEQIAQMYLQIFFPFID